MGLGVGICILGLGMRSICHSGREEGVEGEEGEEEAEAVEVGGAL